MCLLGLLRGLSNKSQLLFSVYYTPGTILSALQALPYFIITANLCNSYYQYLHCTHQEIGTWVHKYFRVTQ